MGCPGVVVFFFFVVVVVVVVANLDRPFFNRKDIRKQKRVAESERVRSNFKYTKGRRSARLVARSCLGWDEGKAGG
jgi:hypothetical protein